jgi:eight-cysteine-cluster-containing protein
MSRFSLTFLTAIPLLIGCTDGLSGPGTDDRGPLGKADSSGSCVHDDGVFCEGPSDGTCWCDTECTGYGDCCDDYEPACTDTNAVIIDESGDGATFQVTKGQVVILRLPSNPTTGYNWAIAATDRTFGYPFATAYYPDDYATGSGGITEMRWSTQSPLPMLGSHTVSLSYKRPWEAENAADLFTFTVEIVSDCMSGEDYCAIVCDGQPGPFLPPHCPIPSCDCPEPEPCFTTGCSGQLCADQHMYTTCEWLPEYACVKLQVCERQPEGYCGWTPTDESQACFDSL